MMEHRKRYIEFMNYIGENGYICVVHDHRGHGESVKSEKNLVIINTRKFDELTNFIRKISYKNIVSNIYPNKYHDLLHEKNKLEIYNYILQWINGI
ncbi:serine aminopeptidase domain-containing protein [uncultured Clostridium sp.]|uniref:serine aminopeptidase domain-containing protein n=1 Tax=uncultured Clostridium sp. TaxID=59620 RepID=UPI0028E7F2C4|nr:alpha/beta hydrolase [uncultured Clostridium sp.]